MGLPVIKKRNGQSQYDYETYCSCVALKLNFKDYDGYANENSRDILFKFKDYLELACVYLCSIVGLIRSFDRISFIWDIDPYFQAYDQAFIIRRVKRNITRMVKSLASQRAIAFKLKNCVKNNPLNAQWTAVFNANIDKFNDRLNTIVRLVNENLESTPYILYTSYLKKHGLSMADDFKAALDKDYFNLIYAEEYDNYDERILNHICDIFSLASNDPDLIQECVANAKQYNEAAKRRSEQRKKEKEEEVIAILKSRRDEAEEILYRVSTRADSMYKANLKNAKSRDLQYYHAGYKPFYIIASINTLKFLTPYDRHRYIPEVLYISWAKASGGLYRSKDMSHAKKFQSFEEAETHANELKNAHPGLETVVCKVDLAWNTAS